MEYLDGPDLNHVIESYGPQPAGRVISILQQMCGSLQEAHEAGLVHRDIKPANVILCQRGGLADIVKVLDFGLVKDVGGSQDLSMANAITGSPAYMSPEAIQTPDDVDARSDIYAVGTVGYVLITGTNVFSGTTALSICSQHIYEAPTHPADRLGGRMDPKLASVIMQCLEKEPQARPQSAAALASALAGCETAGTWTQADARRWWEEFIGDGRKGPRAAPAQFQETIVVDVANRS